MQAILNSLQLALRMSPQLGTLLLISILLPLLLLAILGGLFVWQQGYALLLLAPLAISGVLLAMLFWRVDEGTAADATDNMRSVNEALVEPSDDWGLGDQQAWQQGNRLIVQQLAESSDWQMLDEHALALLSEVAQAYGRTELSFSLPELLSLTEEVSRRYRQVLVAHVPLIEQIPCAVYTTGFAYRHSGQAAVKVAGILWQGYRLSRAVNPLAMLLAEVREKIIGRAFAEVGEQLQYRLKQALLQDVLSVAIDLYSGRFKPLITDTAPALCAQDTQRMALQPDPVRVCIVGQLSSGKSSLVNALLAQTRAQVSVLPSADQRYIHRCQLDDMELLHLVDLPGLDGSVEVEQQCLHEITQSQLVIWVLRADQPGRNPDVALAERVQAFWQQPDNRSKRPPVMLGVLNQIDRLKPIGELPGAAELSFLSAMIEHGQVVADIQVTSNAPLETEKARLVAQALQWNQQQMPGLQRLLPLSLTPEPANLDALQAVLAEQMEQCLQVQFNQRRQAGQQRPDWQTQVKRIYRLGRALFDR